MQKIGKNGQPVTELDRFHRVAVGLINEMAQLIDDIAGYWWWWLMVAAYRTVVVVTGGPYPFDSFHIINPQRTYAHAGTPDQRATGDNGISKSAFELHPTCATHAHTVAVRQQHQLQVGTGIKNSDSAVRWKRNPSAAARQLVVVVAVVNRNAIRQSESLCLGALN